MTLPANRTPWPPRGNAERYQRMQRHNAWYAGDAQLLAAAYAGDAIQMTGGAPTTVNPTPGIARRIASAIRGEFWGQASSTERDARRHLPVPQDIATVSSELLFTEMPMLKIVGVGSTDDEGNPTPLAAAVLAELQRILERCNWHATLLAAGEISSALGSTGLRIALDPHGPLSDQPILVRQDADSTIPNYSWGLLTDTVFWSVVQRDEGGVVWRYLEDHQDGTILHGLYKGTADNIGDSKPLDALGLDKPWAQLPVNDQGALVLLPPGTGATTGISIPNMLPDPLDRSAHAGRSDYTPPVMDLFSAIDSAYSQMMVEIEDARSRLFIADSLLQSGGAGQGVTYDQDQHVYRRVKMPPSQDGQMPIEQVQFAMRVDQYLSAIDALTAKAIRSAGYNAQTVTDEDGGDMTATEFVGRNRRSMSTRDKKARYWLAPLGDLLTTMLRIHQVRFSPSALAGAPLGPNGWRIQVQLPEAVQPTTLELANTAKAMNDAGAASRFILVQTVHPEWTPAEVQTEVDRMQAVDPVTLGTGGVGVGSGDGI